MKTNAPYQAQELANHAAFMRAVALAKDAGRYLLMAGVIAWLYFTQLKPLLARMRTPVQLSVAGHGHAEPVLGEPHALPAATPSGARVNDLDNARQVARDDPRMVANVVKNWVGAE